MTATHHHRRTRVVITIDVHDQSLLTVVIWARQSAHKLTHQLWDHGVLAHVAHVEIDDSPTSTLDHAHNANS